LISVRSVCTGHVRRAALRWIRRASPPPLLADLGLAAALNAQASKSALQNTVKYAHATQARICLQAQNGSLRFTVSDDGTGYDARHIPMGSGLRNMADRLAALGGQLEVRSVPAHGTTITGHLPTVP
jgi:glucose-6-phosphate-specific signal transduction histidine kinase